MSAVYTSKPKNQRGRPRSAAARQSALDAAFSIFEEKGLPGVTMEAVATRAGVGKPTLYRYWSNSHELVMAAVLEQTKLSQSLSARLDVNLPFLDALRGSLTRFIEMFATPKGRQMAAMLAGMEMDSELAKAFRSQILLKGRAEGVAVLSDARSKGQLPDKPIEPLADMLYGAIFYRLLIGHSGIDANFVDDLILLVPQPS
jgi:AcrR family transcriptional regulator